MQRLSEMAPAENEISLESTGAGRIYAGLSWDHIYDTGSRIDKKHMAVARFRDFPKLKTLILYVVFNLFIITLFFRLAFVMDFKVNLKDLIILLTGSTILFSTTAFFYWRLAWQFLSFGEKNKDGEFRDKDFHHFDIDLHCLVLDRSGKPLIDIGPGKPVTSDRSIYHSGEETSGGGVYDDETIHIELNKVSDLYDCFVFFVANDCEYDFDKITNLKVRLVNSASEKTLVEAPVNSSASDGYAFCAVRRTGDTWTWSLLDKYIKFDESWKQHVARLVSSPINSV